MSVLFLPRFVSYYIENIHKDAVSDMMHSVLISPFFRRIHSSATMCGWKRSFQTKNFSNSTDDFDVHNSLNIMLIEFEDGMVLENS